MIASKRIIWVDWIKGLLIYLVVVGHFSIGSYFGYISSFYMVSFFFISGYLYHPHNWKSTTKKFGIPLLIFGILAFFYNVFTYYLTHKISDPWFILSHSYQSLFSTTHLWDGKYYNWSLGIWFVIVLWICRMLMGDIKIFSFVSKYCLESICILCALQLLFKFYSESISSIPIIIKSNYFYRALLCLIFTLSGLFVRQNKEVLLTLLNKNCGLLFILLFLHVLIINVNGVGNLSLHDFGKDLFAFLIDGMIATFILYLLFYKAKSCKTITTLSNGTLFILGLHGIFIGPFQHIMKELIGGGRHYTLAGSFFIFVHMLLSYKMV